MTRVRQFANDMGMSYNQAKNLVNKGRKLKDGGSSILENTMNKSKMIKASNGVYKQGKQVPPTPNPYSKERKKALDEMFPPITKKEFDKLNPKSSIDKLNELSDKKRKQRTKNRKEKVPDRVKGIKDKGDVPVKKIKAKNGKSANFPDLTGDGEVTQADILKGRGVFKMGGTLNYREGGQFRGCGAQVKGKKFKGIF